VINMPVDMTRIGLMGNLGGLAMKKFLLGSVGLAAMIAGPAMAADMRVKAPAPPPVVYYDWSGAYVGFSIGGVWTEVERFYPNLGAVGFPPSTFTSDGDDVIFDLHAGWQWQWGQWVLGAEVGYSAGTKEMVSTVVLPTPPFNAIGISAYNKITDLFTVGPRLGFAWDRWMIYGTGGYATAAIKGQYIVTTTGLQFSPAFHGQSWNHGWFAGAGFEYMIHKGALVDVILGAEYQHFDVSSERAFNDVTIVGAPNTFDQSAVGDIVRARLTIKTQGYSFLWK
jgi:outer membrane immunogenic protein